MSELEVDISELHGEPVDSQQFGNTFRMETEVDSIIDDGEQDGGLEEDDDDMFSITNASVDEDGPVRQKTFTQKERVEMIHLRGNLDRLSEKVDQKQYLVDKQREELKICRQRFQELDLEEHTAKKTVTMETQNHNMAAVHRIRAQLNRINSEREGEKELEAHILTVLEGLEYDLTLAHIEKGRFLLEDSELKQKEADYSEYQKDTALHRQAKEQRFAHQTEHFYQMRDMSIAKMRELEEIKDRLSKEKIKAAHDRHNRYVKETMDHIRRVKQRQENDNREDLERKINSVLNLKKDIGKNRENLASLRARDQAHLQRAHQEQEDYRSNVHNDGGDGGLAVLRERRRLDQLAIKEAFHRDQREKEMEVAAKIASETRNELRKKRVNPELFDNPTTERLKRVGPHRHPKLLAIQSLEREIDTESFEVNEIDLTGSNDIRRSIVDYGDGESSVDEELNDEQTDSLAKYADIIINKEGAAEDLAKPEFEGLWDKHTTYKIPKDEPVQHIKDANASKMDQEIMRRVLDRTRENIVTKQVAAGREFKGQAFYSKPDIIHFKDFVVNKVYQKKIVVTNVSYTINYCKMIGLTERLKDFIEIQFNPPGQLSAGMSCELHVTFSPRINEDLKGEVAFLSQTGPFSIPLICSTKKCDMSVDKSLVDFGTSIIGETLKRHIVLKNTGAKGTWFDFFKRPKHSDESEYDTSTAGISAGVPIETTAVVGEAGGTNAMEMTEADQKEEGQATEVKNEDQTLADTTFVSIDPRQTTVDLLDCLCVGDLTRGEIAAFSEVRLELVWSPNIPDETKTDFVISFEDPDSPNIVVTAVGQAIDVPVWTERNTVDLKICMYDRLYQDTLIVNNRASTALKLKFEVCAELKNHIELLPKTGYIQAHSQFSAQLKFLPRASLPDDAGRYFDPSTGILEVPMVIRVADQTRPVEFTVQAVLTTSDLELSTDRIDFRCCTIYERIIQTIHLTNHSLLPQKFGFVNLPEYVEIQPNDGFGTLLPQEVIDLDVVFSPTKAQEYSFQLDCKSLINRSFTIQCTGVGVHPPLDLSDQVIHFPATALDDVSKTSIYVINSHISTNQYSHPVPRIGTGDIAPVCPTSFEFRVPPNSPIKVSPCVGTIEPGKREHIHIRYCPFLSDEAIREEAGKILKQRAEAVAQQEYQDFMEGLKRAEEEIEKPVPNVMESCSDDEGASKGKRSAGAASAKKAPPKKKTSAKGKRKGSIEPHDLNKGPRPVPDVDPDSLSSEGDDYANGKASLMRQFYGDFETVRIPCYVASGTCPLDPGTLPYTVHNILYLDLHCPSIRPKLAVISDNGRANIDFGGICVGEVVTRSVTVQNISDETLQVRSNILDPSGPFQVVNALRPLAPNASHTLQLQFSCRGQQIYHQVLRLDTGTSKLALTLTGYGVMPEVSVKGVAEPGAVVDLGAVLAGEYIEHPLTLTNPSSLQVELTFRLDSTDTAALADRSMVGVQNLTGRAVFDCLPTCLRIPPNESRDVTITFAPDHPSAFFSDAVRILQFGQESHMFRVVGQGKPHTVFMTGGEPLHPNREYIGTVNKPLEDLDYYDDESMLIECADVTANDTQESWRQPIGQTVAASSAWSKPKPSTESCLLTFGALMLDNGKVEPAQRVMYFGGVRALASNQKKNGEFVFDNVSTLTPLGFTIEPQRGQVESGGKKPVQFTWTPPANHDPNKPLEAFITVTTKGDISEQLKINLRALVVSDRSTIPNETID